MTEEHEDVNQADVQPERDGEQQEQPVKSDQEINWERAREKMESLERDNNRYKEMLYNISLNQQQGQQPQQQQSEPDYDADDWVTEGKFRQQFSEIKKQQDQINQRFNQQAKRLLKREYSDFDQVVTSDNINFIERQHPAMAQALASIQDPVERLEEVYAYIKSKRGGGKPNLSKDHDTRLSQSQRQSKPVEQEPETTSALAAARELGESLTAERKRELWLETQRYAKLRR